MNTLKNIKALILFCVSLVTLMSATAFGAASHNLEKFNTVLKSDGTVGTVLLYFQNNEPYILLGKEKKPDSLNSQGTYSDFGGKVKVGESLIQTAIEKLNLETSHVLNLNPEDYSSNVYVLHKTTDKGRDVVYGVYLINEEQFKKLIRIPSNNVKDNFIWLPVKELISSASGNNIKINDIDGLEHTVTIREYFLKDCLKNPDFKSLIEELSAERVQN